MSAGAEPTAAIADRFFRRSRVRHIGLTRSAQALELMRRIKHALAPRGPLNPSKVIV